MSRKSASSLTVDTSSPAARDRSPSKNSLPSSHAPSSSKSNASGSRSHTPTPPPDRRVRPRSANAKVGVGDDDDEKSNVGRSNDHAKKAKSHSKKKKGGNIKQVNFFSRILGEIGIGGDNIEIKNPRALEAVNTLGLTQRNLKRLKYVFGTIDVDGTGSIDSNEFFEFLGENPSPFTDALFAMIDLDGSGTVEYEEFVSVLATYCLFTRDEILRFCFELFDKDGSGNIDDKEFADLCKAVNNAAPMFPGNFARALEEFDVNDDGLIDYSEFTEMDRRYPLVLFPAYRIQDAMQKNTLGEAEWLSIIQDFNHARQVEEYKQSHGGQEPLDSRAIRALKVLLPCMSIGPKRRVKAGRVGMALEMDRRRQNASPSKGGSTPSTTSKSKK